MQFTLKALSVLAASLLFSAVSAVPQCQPGNAWPDVHDCHNFYECAAGGIPVLKTCGPGTAYCPVTGVCDYEFKIPSCHPRGAIPKGPEHDKYPKYPKGSEHDQYREGPEHDKDHKGSEHDKDHKGSEHDKDHKGSEHDKDHKGSEHDKDH
ncbi:collagen-like protein 6, partial [Aspergillus udagawae]